MKKQLALTAGLGLSLLSFDGIAEARTTDLLAEDSPYQTQVSTGVNKANRTQYYGNVNVFIPLVQSRDRVLFSELGQQQSFDKGSVSSVDFGLRWLTDSANQLFGVHAGFDYQQSKEFNAYSMINVGAQWRSSRWHVYGNAYLPLTKSHNEANYHQWQLEPDTNSAGFYNVLQLAGQEKALTGYEANAGYQFWQRYNAAVYVGGYRYSATDVKTITGSRVQLQFDVFNAFRDHGKAQFLNRITVESGFQHDNMYKTNWYSGVTFVFNLGKAQKLRGLEPYMQYGVDRTKGTLVRPNDDVGLELFTKADGTALTIAQVSNQAQLSNAIDNNADVIAVQGAIDNVETLVLKPDQILTGGAYTLSNGVQLQPGSAGTLTAQADQDLIRVSRNNRIENITLNVDGYNAAITNLADSRVTQNVTGASIGQLRIDNVSINTGSDIAKINLMAAVNVLINDGSLDSTLSVTNSQFTFGAVNNSSGIYALVEAGNLQTSITNNTMTFADGNKNEGILFYTQARTADANIIASEISNNQFSFGDGNNNSGIELLASRAIDSTLQYATDITVTAMHNNKVVMGTGNNNNGYFFQAASAITGEKTTLNVNSFITNSASFVGGTSLAGVNTDPGIFGNGQLTLRNVLNNRFTLPTGSNNYGFNVTGSSDPTSSVVVYVGDNGVSLSAANHNATLNPAPRGNVDIYP